MSVAVALDEKAQYAAALKKELHRRERVYHAQRNYLGFMKYAWHWPGALQVGLHTKMVCKRIDKAVEDFEKGKSTRLVFLEPFRHGKSDRTSRYLPSYIMGRLAKYEPNVIATGYGLNLVKKFSAASKQIIRSKKYAELFPGVRMSQANRSNELWKVEYECGDNGERYWEPSSGEVTVAGLQGAIMGSGYEVGILDDYCKSRAKAEKPDEREKNWESFRDFLTRAGPTSITIVACTPWHTDDIAGRITSSMQADPSFPRFEFMVFPAMGPGRVGASGINTEDGEIVEYPHKYLFPKRYSDEWYEGQAAQLGGWNSYGASGLLRCNPVNPKGNMYNTDKIVVHANADKFPKDIKWVRVWDLASTEKETAKGDPDFTCGMLMGVQNIGGAGIVWIKDLVAGQWGVIRRDAVIRDTALKDGPDVRLLVESVGAYKDTVETLKFSLRGIRTVEGVTVSGGDKTVRGECLICVFDAGNVNIVEAPWNDIFYSHLRPFPNAGIHDDAADCLIIGFRYLYQPVPLGFFSVRDRDITPR